MFKIIFLSADWIQPWIKWSGRILIFSDATFLKLFFYTSSNFLSPDHKKASPNIWCGKSVDQLSFWCGLIRHNIRTWTLCSNRQNISTLSQSNNRISVHNPTGTIDLIHNICIYQTLLYVKVHPIYLGSNVHPLMV